MIPSSKNSGCLRPTDPPILLAGLIAARRAGDKLLAAVLRRELESRCGITVRFLTAPQAESEGRHGD
jgi:hypothetical protein